ncbi:MAG: hypothetical protein LBM92_00320 [Opitutaceae bacterium]|nr:hypothetical protein [Opitutaceae bacterium]
MQTALLITPPKLRRPRAARRLPSPPLPRAAAFARPFFRPPPSAFSPSVFPPSALQLFSPSALP